MPGGYREWEFVFPLSAREWERGRGNLHGTAWACVVAHRGIGGLCGEYILLSLPSVSSDVVKEVNSASPELCDCFGARTLGILQRPFRCRHRSMSKRISQRRDIFYGLPTLSLIPARALDFSAYMVLSEFFRLYPVSHANRCRVIEPPTPLPNINFRSR